MNCKFCVIDNSWLMQESPGLKPDWFGEIRLKPDWFGEIRLFSSKKLNSSSKISLSKIFPHIGSNETGQ